MAESDSCKQTADILTCYGQVQSTLSRQSLKDIQGLQNEERRHGLRDRKTILRFSVIAGKMTIPYILTQVYVTNFHHTRKTGPWTITGSLAREIAPKQMCFVLIVYFPEDGRGNIYTTSSELKKARLSSTASGQTPDNTR